ncbi:8-oxoguanine DNA glycosylase OGG fold protein [Pelobium manganitolerans]|uniref:8-oxoguanine DNA glycosylase OGG fold protein n=1 Tax=Pelobium manganitolerans TaxID=1842495 RepID=UPI003FA37C96
MNISSYKTLISNLPVRQQSFTTKRTTWLKAESKISWLKQLNDKLFGDKSTYTISRQDIFETTDIREKIIKTIYWGYTGGMRGNHFINILENIDLIENTFKSLKQIPNPTTDDFNKLITTFKKVTGLGLSTYSKLLYFLQLTFNDNPCLILDQRLIDVFVSKTYSEFQQLSILNDYNKEKRYLDFLQLMDEVSKELGTEEENIEQFLFIFGNNLK